jgi:hypothetical protein
VFEGLKDLEEALGEELDDPCPEIEAPALHFNPEAYEEEDWDKERL